MRALLVLMVALVHLGAVAPARADLGHGRCGDANGDGTVDVADVVTVLRFVSGLDTLTAEQFLNADLAPVVVEFEREGRRVVRAGRSAGLDVADIVTVLRVTVGLDDVAGCGPAPLVSEIVPDRTCADGEARVRLIGRGLFSAQDAPTVIVDGAEVEVTRREILGDGSQAAWFRMPSLAAVPAAGILVTVAVATPSGLDIAPLPLRVEPACTAAPLATDGWVAESHPWFETKFELWGDKLACARRVTFVGQQSGTEIEAPWFTPLNDQVLEVVLPPSRVTTSEFFDVIVESPCGRSTAPYPRVNWWPTTVPDVTSISPASGHTFGGYSVSLRGTSLDGVSSIALGSTTLIRDRDFSAISDEEIIIWRMPGTFDPFLTIPLTVVAENHGATDSTPVTFTYTGEPVPSCSSLAPTSGPLTGGTEIVIASPSAYLITAVLFDGVAASDFGTSGTHVFARTPAFPMATDVEVVLQRNGVSLSTCPQRFTFTPW